MLQVRGQLDVFTAPVFEAVLNTLVDGGHVTLVVDLAQLGFVDASGLGVIALVSERLRDLGGAITLRTPSATVSHLLSVGSLTELVEVGN